LLSGLIILRQAHAEEAQEHDRFVLTFSAIAGAFRGPSWAAQVPLMVTVASHNIPGMGRLRKSTLL